jgi:flagellar hook-basal body complex protein FliE
MAGILPIGGIESLFSAASARVVQAAPTNASFTGMLTSGLREVDAKVAKADVMVQAFAEGQAIPVHQVTLAIEQARLAVELATQIRTRLIETYREFMTMQV